MYEYSKPILIYTDKSVTFPQYHGMTMKPPLPFSHQE